jgi:Ctr copper transporter family
MDTSGMTNSSGSSSMTMVFTNSQTTPLYSSAWTPSTTGAYAGTCIFLILLALFARVLLAFKAEMERRWLETALHRRSVVVAGKTPEAQRIEATPDVKAATLVTASGVEESVQRAVQSHRPWRFSVDLPRALLHLCFAGVSYLL